MMYPSSMYPSSMYPSSKSLSRFVILASGSGTNFQAILNACAAGALPAQAVALFCNRKSAYALERARLAGIPAHHVPFVPSTSDPDAARRQYDAQLAAQVQAYAPDYVVLAGWMRLLTMDFLRHFSGRVINLHPALPGAFPGTEAIARAYAAYQQGAVQHTGVMVHYVPDEGVDDGPVIATEVVPILPADTLADLEARVHAVEHRLLVAALKQVITQPDVL